MAENKKVWVCKNENNKESKVMSHGMNLIGNRAEKQLV